MANYDFDATNFNPQYGGGGMLPVGKHPVMIVETELKPTQAGTGGYLALTMEAIDGPSKGVRHTDRLNLHNQNAQTVEIAHKQLSAYCYVTGVFKFRNTDELCKRPFVVDIQPQKKSPEMTEVVGVYTSDMRKASEVLQSGNAPTQAPVIPAQIAPSEAASSAPEPTAAWGTVQAEAKAAAPWGASPTGQSAAPWGPQS